MFIKKAFILFVLATLARVSSVAGKGGAANNSTWADISTSSFLKEGERRLEAKWGLAPAYATLMQDPQLQTGYGWETLTKLWFSDEPYNASDRACLPTRVLEKSLENLLELEQGENCLQIKQYIFSKSDSMLGYKTTNCTEYMRPICEEVLHSIETCNIDTWTMLLELFRCDTLKKIAASYLKSENLRKRFHKSKDPEEFALLASHIGNPRTSGWKVTLEDLSLQIDHRCPLDCTEYHRRATSQEYILVSERLYRLAVMTNVGIQQAMGTLLSFPYPTEQDALDNTGFKDFPDMTQVERSLRFQRFQDCVTHEGTPGSLYYCEDCALELGDRLDLPLFEITCQELLQPFCKPSFACLMCGTCRQHTNAIFTELLLRFECSLDCDDYVFSK